MNNSIQRWVVISSFGTFNEQEIVYYYFYYFIFLFLIFFIFYFITFTSLLTSYRSGVIFSAMRRGGTSEIGSLLRICWNFSESKTSLKWRCSLHIYNYLNAWKNERRIGKPCCTSFPVASPLESGPSRKSRPLHSHVIPEIIRVPFLRGSGKNWPSPRGHPRRRHRFILSMLRGPKRILITHFDSSLVDRIAESNGIEQFVANVCIECASRVEFVNVPMAQRALLWARGLLKCAFLFVNLHPFFCFTLSLCFTQKSRFVER